MESRCSNCMMSFSKIRVEKRSLSVNPEIISLLKKWHSARMINDKKFLCKKCLYLIKKVMLSGETEKPVFGHTHICPDCGRSVKNARVQKISPDDDKDSMKTKIYNIFQESIIFNIPPSIAVCHACYKRAVRKLQKVDREKAEEINSKDENIAEPDPEPTLRPQEPETIILPNYKRADTQDQCVLSGCEERSVIEIPMVSRKKVLIKHQYYLPPDCRICKSHSEAHCDEIVKTGVKLFTAEHIEDMLEVLKSNDRRCS